MGLELGQKGAAAVAAPESGLRSTPARLGYVDGLRTLAALEVMVGHMSGVVWRAGLAPALTIIGGYGHASVSVFIVLSGFSLMLPVARNANRLPDGALGFYWRRARRILPPYYAALALSLALIWLLIGHNSGTIWDVKTVTPIGVGEHLLMIYNLSSTNYNSINPVLWSVAMECQIYLLFPLFLVLWRRYDPLFCAAIIAALSLGLTTALIPTWIGHLPGYGMYSFAPQYIGLFAMGMLAAGIFTHRRPAIPPAVWETLAVVCVVATLVYTSSVSPALLDYVTGLGALAVLLSASRPSSPIRRALEWRPLVWIGGFSYSLYLIHAPLLQVIWQYGLHPLHLSDMATYLLLLVVGGPLIVLAAWGFWRLCERPFLNSRVTSKRVKASA